MQQKSLRRVELNKILSSNQPRNSAMRNHHALRQSSRAGSKHHVQRALAVELNCRDRNRNCTRGRSNFLDRQNETSRPKHRICVMPCLLIRNPKANAARIANLSQHGSGKFFYLDRNIASTRHHDSDDCGNRRHRTRSSDSHSITLLHSLCDQASAEGVRKIPQLPIGQGLFGICQRDGIRISVDHRREKLQHRRVPRTHFRGNRDARRREPIVMLSHVAVGSNLVPADRQRIRFHKLPFPGVNLWATQR